MFYFYRLFDHIIFIRVCKAIQFFRHVWISWENYYVFVIMLSMMMTLDNTMFGYPIKGFMVDLDIELCFFSRGFYLIFRRNSIEFLIEFSVLETF